jgi:alpha-D-glucose phosphate-specific phosphoglucomutase
MAIVFGTDGWRGVIADDFTFANVALVAQAAAEYFKEEPNAKNGVVIGYDARFMSDRFARTVARVLASHGIPVLLSDDISSTPQVSLAAKQKNLAGGIIITASHNPAIYNGFKLKACFGGPATPEDVQKVQDRVTALEAEKAPVPSLPDFDELVRGGKVILFDAKREYIDYVKTKIDLGAIANAGFRVLYDPMYGSGIHTMEHLLPNVDQIHNSFNPSFGELDHPEPLGEYLGVLMNGVKTGGYSVGLATDGDADRLGMVDEDGHFVDSHRIFVLLMQYLFEDRKQKGSVAKTISLTTMIDDYCSRNNIHMFETPVGFKFIAKLMTTENLVIGGEESGGLGTNLHIPERDGIFNGLLVLEMMARRGKTLGELSRSLDDQFGMHRYRRVDKLMTVEQKERILSAAKSGVTKLGQYDVSSTRTLDGFKFFVDGGWLLIRASGTEPLLRYYAEADTVAKVEALLQAGMTLGS